MAGRQSHGAPVSKTPKAKSKSKKRTLDAFAIASHQNPDRIKVRQNRLGALEGGNRPGKRRRQEDEDEDEEEETNSKKQRKAPEKKGRFDQLDLDEGSDSEGNEWKLGQVDSDDDSDLDSDEAFGESDEERFEGFAFSGSSEKKSKKKKPGRARGINLDEDEEEESDSELEEGDLGEGAVDLADMLDASSDDENSPGDDNRSGSEEDADDSDSESSASSADEDDDDDDDSANPEKLAALQDLIANLAQTDASSRGSARQRSDGAAEYNTPSDFGVASKTKLTLEDLGLPSISDPHIKKSLKLLESESKGKSVPGKLEVPLARRQQDRLDRGAAYDKSKETLDRWTDTIKHNRRADHLMFPLQDPDGMNARSNKELQPTNLAKPFNELEATIQSILEESGLATADGKDDEDRLREFEELETNKLSLEEVKARRDQLRMARELLFREEAKAKRIKKIKSKSYRKVHRRQREKEERMNQEALAEGGFEPSEDELEAQDRRRAEERMGAKHRGSKWAKAMKATGRTAWDEDARSGVTEMARRDEELRKRIEGKALRKDVGDDSDESVSDSEDMSEDDEDAERKRLLKQLNKVNGDGASDESGPGSRLANLKFMRKADAARKQKNDAMVEEMRKELAGEGSASEEEDGDIGRRIFGPAAASQAKSKSSDKSHEFEEPTGSDNDEDADFQGFDTEPKATTASSSRPSKDLELSKVSSVTATEARRRKHRKNRDIDVELDLDDVATASSQPPPKPKPSSAKPQATKKGIQTLDVTTTTSDSETEEAPHGVNLPFAIRDQELIKRAFAGADVVGEFESEKRQVMEDEDEKTVDDTLPGWGGWVGSGVSKKDKARNKGRVLRKVAGVKEQDRRDRGMEKVIINEKKVKKNAKYLSPALPHPFETKAQYERSMRLPLGPEWSTKQTFQEATKPRVLLKQGIIAPMAKPWL